MMKLRNLIALGILGVLTLGAGVGMTLHTNVNKADAIATVSPYSHIFTTGELNKTGGTVNLSGVEWTYDSMTYYGFDGNNNRGVQIGSSGSPQNTEWTIRTSVDNFDDVITNITVNACTGGSATLNIYSDGSLVSSSSLSKTSMDYALDLSASPTNEIKIGMIASSKAMYIKSIEIEFGITYGLEVSQEVINAQLGDDPIILTATPNSSYGENPYVSWSILPIDTNVISLSEKEGLNNTVTFLAEGNAQIKVEATDKTLEAPISEKIIDVTVSKIREFEQIHSIDDLTTGSRIILGSSKTDGTKYAMGDINDDYRAAKQISAPNNIINSIDGLETIIATKVNESWALYCEASGGYLSYSGSGNTVSLSEKAEVDSAKWNIEYIDNVFKIQNVGTNNRYLQFNNSNPRFACYAGTQTNLDLYLETSTDPQVVLNNTNILGYIGDSDFTISSTIKNFTSDEILYEWGVEPSNIIEVVGNSNESSATFKYLNTGKATITLTAVSQSEQASATCEVTVGDILTVETAKSMEDNTNVRVKGVISGKYGTSGVFIADSTTGVGMQVFKFDASELTTGDEIIIDGTVSSFNGTKQISSGAKLVKKLNSNVEVHAKEITPDNFDASMVSDYLKINDAIFDEITGDNISFKVNGNTLNVYCPSGSADYKQTILDLLVDAKANMTSFDITGVIGIYKGNPQFLLTDAIKVEINYFDSLIQTLMGENTDGQCVSKFAIAKSYYLSLTAEEQNEFKTNALYSLAKERYEAWARALGEDPYIAGSATNLAELINDNNMILIIVLISTLSVSTIALFAVSKKRKTIKK